MLLGFSLSLNTALVTKPKVPSVPIKSCFKSYPELFFSISFKDVTILPSANTASNPSTESRVIPYLTTMLPPALVDMLPPMVHEPLAPKSTASIKLFSSATF